MASNSCLIAEIDEQLWICQIRQMLEEEPEDADEDIQASIFSVPITLRATNPEIYTPQLVALGPYHRNHPHLLEMERNKLLLAKKTHQHLLESVKFQLLVDQLKLLDSKIRASYHKHLGFSREMMSWMMAIDAAFLLHFLQMQTMTHNKRLPDNAIIRDVVMLENQIPLLVLRKTVEMELQTFEAVEDSLQYMLVSLCKDLSHFEMAEEAHQIPASECAHVLDFLYRVVAPKLELSGQEVIEECKLDKNERRPRLVELLFRFKKVVVWFLNKLLLSRPMKIVLALPLIFICHLPALAILKDPVENLFSAENVDHEQKLEIEPRIPNNRNNALPSVEEIMIPSVSELSKSGIIFVPTKGGISGINFDAKTNEFRLPIVSLDLNSEVVLRNLVAYEATSSFGPLSLARYTELMNGIIDSEEDARLLREKGIILNRMKSDEEVARLWNGMSKSLRLTKILYLDRVIEDVNVYYNRSWRVKFGKFTEVYVSRQVLTFVAVVMFLFLMSMQVFSSAFNSTRRRPGTRG